MQLGRSRASLEKEPHQHLRQRPDASLLAALGPAARSPPKPADRIDRAAGLACGRSHDVDFGVGREDDSL